MDIKELEEFINYKPIFDENPQFLVDDIKNQAAKYLPKEQIDLIQKSYEFALKAHKGQKRLSGEPYIVHPVRATQFLMMINPDVASIQACLLHDVIEDTSLTYDDIKKEFGEEVANLCD
jgi:GTP pyrophosphokinase